MSREDGVVAIVSFVAAIVILVASYYLMFTGATYVYDYEVSAQIVGDDTADDPRPVTNYTDIQQELFADGFASVKNDDGYEIVRLDDHAGLNNRWYTVSINGVTVLYELDGPDKGADWPTSSDRLVGVVLLVFDFFLVVFATSKGMEWYNNRKSMELIQ